MKEMEGEKEEEEGKEMKRNVFVVRNIYKKRICLTSLRAPHVVRK